MGLGWGTELREGRAATESHLTLCGGYKLTPINIQALLYCAS